MPDSADPSMVPGRLRGVAARHPFLVFLVLVFGAGWPVLAVPVLAERGLIAGRSVPPELFALVVTWLVMLPAALGVTAASGGGRAVRELLARAARWRLGGWWAVVLLALPVTTLATGLVLGGRLETGSAPVLLDGFLSLLTAVLVIHLVEETVWAGFLQTRLEARHTLVVAALITAVPFSAIHLPLLLLGEPSGAHVLVGAAKLFVLGVGMRLMLGVFLRGTGSVLAVGLLHGVYNASNNRGGLVDGLLEGADQNLAAPIALVVVTVSVGLSVRRTRRAAPGRPARAAQTATVSAASPAGPSRSRFPEVREAAPVPHAEGGALSARPPSSGGIR